jgi:hypothetical protein
VQTKVKTTKGCADKGKDHKGCADKGKDHKGCADKGKDDKCCSEGEAKKGDCCKDGKGHGHHKDGKCAQDFGQERAKNAKIKLKKKL